MLAPLSWIKEFVDIPTHVSPQNIADALIRVGFEVENVIEQGKDLNGPIVFGEVLTIEEVTGQKKPIRYVGLDCGEGQTRYVICGATNFSVGDRVVVALPGSVLPGNFAISARETYGKTSNGMICSARELGLGDDHSGIMVFAPSTVDVGSDALAGLQIEDVIFDIAINPDRGYGLSIRGISREIASALTLPFRDPVDQVKDFHLKDGGVPVQAAIADPKTASVFYLRTTSDFDAQATKSEIVRR